MISSLSRISLPDVNGWVALAIEGHPHSQTVKLWFDHQPADSVSFCRLTQMSFLPLLTSHRVFHQDARTVRQAWALYQDFLADPRIVFSPEPAMLEAAWILFMQQSGVGPSAWTDAYLAAFALEYDQTIVTFDRDFVRWPNLKLHLLSLG